MSENSEKPDNPITIKNFKLIISNELQERSRSQRNLGFTEWVQKLSQKILMPKDYILSVRKDVKIRMEWL